MDGNFFFVLGGVLVLAALGIAFIGIRGSDSFPGSRVLMVGATGLFAAIVVGTMAFAVVKSRDEQDKRREDQAKEEAAAQAEAGQPPAPGGAAGTLAVSSPQDGSLTFDPNGLQAQPGTVTITYDNPSPVPHSIALATANGNILDQTDPFAAGKQSITASDLTPGEYTFFCTVPGHKEAGMEGTLTVGAGQTEAPGTAGEPGGGGG
jgi:plastocyanin